MLAFHIALVRNPQEAIVVRAFAALLYHGNWSKAVEFAREHETSVIGYAPEVSKSSRKRSDEDLAEAVSEFTCLLKDTQYVLTDKEALREALYLYPDFKFSGLVSTNNVHITIQCTKIYCFKTYIRSLSLLIYVWSCAQIKLAQISASPFLNLAVNAIID